jgi:hypothetical protein
VFENLKNGINMSDNLEVVLAVLRERTFNGVIDGMIIK